MLLHPSEAEASLHRLLRRRYRCAVVRFFLFDDERGHLILTRRVGREL